MGRKNKWHSRKMTFLHLGRKFFAVAVWAVVAIPLVGCGGEDPNIAVVKEAKEIYTNGLKHLAAAEYRQAELEFFRIIDDDPDSTSTFFLDAVLDLEPLLADQARFGYIVSQVLAEINDAVTSVAKIVAALITATGSGAPEFTTDTLRATVGSSQFQMLASGLGIESVIDDLLTDGRKIVDQALKQFAIIKMNPDFQMDINTLPIKFANIDVMSIPGEYDLGEVYFALTIGSLINSFIDGTRAIDLNLDLLSVVPKILDYMDYANYDPLSMDDIPLTITNLGAVVLHLSPTLFTVQDQDLVKDGANLMADSSGYFGKMIQELRRDYKDGDEDQTDDVIGYEPAGGEDDFESMVWHYEINLAVPGVSLNDLEDLKIEIRSDVMNAVDNIEKAFRGTGDGRIEWARDIVPILSLAVVTILRTGVLNGILAAAIGTDEAGDGANSLLDILDSPIITPDLVSGLIAEFIPDVFRFNVKGYIEKPEGGLRSIFPLWTTPQDGVGDKSRLDTVAIFEEVEYTEAFMHPLREIWFMYQYECGDGKDYLITLDLVCEKANRDKDVFTSWDMPLYVVAISATTDNTEADASGTLFPRVDHDVFKIQDKTPPNQIRDYVRPNLTDEESVMRVYTAVHPTRVTTESLYDRDSFSSEHSKSNSYLASIKKGEVWGMSKDGLKNYLPYIAFQDASMGGLIEYNFQLAEADLGPEGRKEMADLIGTWTTAQSPKSTTNKALNALIALVSGKIFDLFGSF